MNTLDVVDRAERHTRRRLTVIRWRAVLLLAPVGAAMGVGFAASAAVVWLVADFTGVWGVAALGLAGAALGAHEAWRDPARYVKDEQR